MSTEVFVRQMTTEEEIRRCYPVMVQLRPHLTEDAFLARVQQQMQEGYHLAGLEAGGQVKAVAGFRIHSMLSRSRFMYVDDLVTDQAARSEGWGKTLLDWLKQTALQQGCQQLDLDSGVQRTGAHRFYFREGLHIPSFHFTIRLKEPE
jgi:GNAT superfamily N-acetyltransferase